MDTEVLKLAFAYHMILQAIGSDAQVDADELEWLKRTFPPELMSRHGLLDASGRPTATFEEARDLALVELPERLTPGEKLVLVELLVEACAADGVLAAEEVDVLAAAASMLGLQDDAWMTQLQEQLASGRLRRDGAGID